MHILWQINGHLLFWKGDILPNGTKTILCLLMGNMQHLLWCIEMDVKKREFGLSW